MAEKPRNIPLLLTPDDEDKKSVQKQARRPVKGIGQWIMHMNSEEYLHLVPGSADISSGQLAVHNSEDDLWMALPHEGRLSVFDITSFAPYHPGGIEILLQNAGRDASEAFRMAHAYVNVDMVGRLRKGFLRKTAGRSYPKLLPNMMPPFATTTVRREKPAWNWELSQNRSISLSVMFPTFGHAPEPLSWMDNLRSIVVWYSHSDSESDSTETNSLLFRTVLDNVYHCFEFRLLSSYVPDLQSFQPLLSVNRDSSQLSLSKPRICLGLKSKDSSSGSSSHCPTSIGSVLLDILTPTNAELNTHSDRSFIRCRVVESKRLQGTRYRFLHLAWSANSAWMPFPIGHHCILRLRDSTDGYISRPYTPVPHTLFGASAPTICPRLSPFDAYFLVKVYRDGQMSPLLDALKPDDELEISLPIGHMPINFMSSLTGIPPQNSPWTDIFMLAAGSGITPMLRVIDSILYGSGADGSAPCPTTLHMICFDRTQADQVLTNELEKLCIKFSDRLSVLRVLSEAKSELPSGAKFVTGIISDDICRTGLLTLTLSGKEPISVADSTLWLICGPSGFNKTALEIAKHWFVPDKNIVVFKG
ncbi:unnamed protein product [Calicophoron daubneyi]|uniref:Cytochrome-b5 reductase n=1 Tax=Calicophoron daubneyi TaxID=300641 RepID=A0AAV2T7K6_CALDB